MAAALWSLAVPLLAAVFLLVAQAVAYRFMDAPGRLIKSELAGAMIGFAALLLASGLGPFDAAIGWPTLIANCAIYAALAVLVFQWNDWAEADGRIRLLRELLAAPEGLGPAALQDRYPAREILERRLTRLSDAEQIDLWDGKLTVTGRTAPLALRLAALARLIVFGRLTERR